MVVGLALFLAGFEPCAYIAGRCSAAHRDLDRASVTVDVQTVGIYSTEKTRYDLAYARPGSADLTIQRARPFRIVVADKKLTEYDPAAHQYDQQDTGEESVDVTVRRSAGVLDELVASLLEADGVSRWATSLRIGRVWNFDYRGSEFVLKSDQGDSLTSVTIDAETLLLKSVSTKARQYGTDWKFHYGAPRRQFAFTPPSDARLVNQIRPEIVAPAYASAQSKAVCERIFRKYDHTTGLGYAVTTADESFEVWMDGVRARQRDKMADWTIDDETASVLDLTHQTIKSGKASLTALVDAVSESGTRIEPLLKLLLKGINPFRFYLGQNAVVKVTGSTKVQGEKCSIVQADSPSGVLSIIARDKDGFVLSLVSVPKGSTDSTSKTFRPLAVGPETFRLAKPEGWASRSLNVAVTGNVP